jgi:2-hydroxychromene-2-carboxylate isomerase
MSAPAAVEFWFEFASTYSYPASQRIEALAAERGVPVVWRAFLLGPIFHEQGWNDSPFNLYPVKGRYMWRDLERICAGLDLPFRRPSQFPRGSLVAARIVSRFAGEPWVPSFVRAVYRANFAEDRDIAHRDVVTDCLLEGGAPAAAVLADAESPEGKQALRDATAEAARRGVFGAPSFLVGGELFWGNDRLEAALAWDATAA